MPPGPTPDVSILVPVLNEQDTVRELLTRLLALDFNAEVVVVDDGSTDGTAGILEEFGDAVVALRNANPTGKGMAIRKALGVARGKVVVIQDADLEYFPEELPMLVEPILSGAASVVYGTRFSRGMHPQMAWPNKLVNRLLVWFVRVVYGAPITDEATCYKAFRRDLLLGMDLQCSRFEFCPEVTGKAIRMGQRIHEIPIRYEPRSKLAGKKIRWTDAPVAFWTLVRYRFWRPRG